MMGVASLSAYILCCIAALQAAAALEPASLVPVRRQSQGAIGTSWRGQSESHGDTDQASLQEHCKSFLTEADEHVRGHATQGDSGGQWSACTHLKVYGLNFAPFLARFLSYQLAPKTALEFGCGLGTTSDFVARFANATVTCVEPERTLGELIKSLRGEMRGNGALQQLALNVFSDEPEVQKCVTSGALKSDLVFSFEVAEHIPAKFRDGIVSTLANATGKWLVFSAARPGQGGTGHLPDSMLWPDQWKAKFEAAGLVHMPKLTELARHTAYPQRSYDLFSNLLVFRNPAHEAEDTDLPHPKLAKFGDWWGNSGGCQSCQRYSDPHNPISSEGNTKARSMHLSAFNQGSNSALWPGLTDKEASVRGGELCHNSALIQQGGSSQEVGFESAWGAYFYKH